MAVTDSFGEGLSRGWTLADVKAALRRRSRLILITFLALSAGAVAAVILAPPIHEGDFKILVKRDRADAVVSGTANDTMSAEELSENDLLSQVELLKAQDLREKVAVDAGLTARLLHDGDARTNEEALAQAVKALERDLNVAPIRKTWLIDVTYRDKDRQITRKVLDAVSQAYFEKHLSLHRPSGAFEFFSSQVGRARQEVEQAQAALVAFTQHSGIVAADAEKQAVLQNLTQFISFRAQAQAELAAARRREAAAREELKVVPATHVAQTRVTQNAGAAEQIQSSILTLELKRTELLQRFTPEYRGVAEIDQQLTDARAALARALETRLHEETIGDNPTRQWLDAELTRSRTDAAGLDSRVQSLSATIGRYQAGAQLLEARGIEQNDLTIKLAAAQDRYRLYLTKQEEARISDALDKTRIANAAIAQPPTLKLEAQRRPSLAMLPLLIIIALFLSGGLALAFDALADGAVPETPAERVTVVTPAPAWRATPPSEGLHQGA